MKRYVLDTNLYIEAGRDRDWAEELARFVSAYLPLIHLHAVVAQELLAGALDAGKARLVERGLVRPFEKRGRVVTPSFGTWKRAGSIMARLVHAKKMSPGGFGRSFVNDCLLGVYDKLSNARPRQAESSETPYTLSDMRNHGGRRE